DPDRFGGTQRQDGPDPFPRCQYRVPHGLEQFPGVVLGRREAPFEGVFNFRAARGHPRLEVELLAHPWSSRALVLVSNGAVRAPSTPEPSRTSTRRSARSRISAPRL